MSTPFDCILGKEKSKLEHTQRLSPSSVAMQDAVSEVARTLSSQVSHLKENPCLGNKTKRAKVN